MGFFSPSLSFATGLGSFITGAAKQANENFAKEDAQKQQDEKIWIAKFADSMKTYEADMDKKKDTNFVFQTLKNALNGNESAADQGVAQWIANGRKGDIGEIIKRLSPSPAADPAYKAVTPTMLDESLNRKYQNLNNIRGNMRPQMQKLFPQPIAPTQMGYAEGGMADDGLPQDPMNPAIGSIPQEAPQQPQSFDLSGTTTTANAPGTQVAQAPGYNAVWNHDIAKDQNSLIKDIFDKYHAQGFDSTDSAKKFNDSVTKNPKDPRLWNIDGIIPPQSKLSKEIEVEVAKAMPYMSMKTPEERKAFDTSVRDAHRTGDSTKIRWDLAPSKSDIDAATNAASAGKEAGHVYVRSLEKRAGTINSSRAIETASDRIIDMVSDPNNPLHANAFQPFLDEVNRGFSALGVDLRSLGLKANSIEDVNMFKKVIGDMTFQQISQYHLGRWTNYEVGLLKDKLPSMNTDPNSMLRVALLFKKAARREMDSHAKETELAYGKNGENMLNPDPKGLGQAKFEQVQTVTRDEGKAPWPQTNDYFAENNSARDKDAYAKIPNGTWFEDTKSKAMVMKGGGANGQDLYIPSTSKP